MQARFTPLLAVIVVLVPPAFTCAAWAQAPAHRSPTLTHETGPTGSYVMTGRLERREERFLLVDQDGELEAYLIPRESLNLDSYVGKSVELSVREPLVRQGSEPRVWVDRIAVAGSRATRPAPNASRSNRPLPVPFALAQFTEPITDEELAIPGVEIPGMTAPTAAVPVEESVSPCGPKGWIWGGVDYLLWRTDGMYVPALVTTSPTGTPRTQAGVLGEPGTTVLFGGDELFTEDTNGGRLRAGLYFDRQSAVGIEGEYLMLQSQDADFSASSNASGTPILARPFFNMNPRNPLTDAFAPPAREDSRLASYPGVISGSVTINTSSQFQSMGLALRSLLACESFYDERRTSFSRVDLITGYRYLQLNDDILVTEDLGSLDHLPLVSFDVYDQFNTRNQIHALDIGAIWQGGWQQLSLDLTFKTAVGYATQEVDIQGGTVIAQTGSSVAYPGGVLALPSNIGLHSRERLAVVPELSALAGFHITKNIRLTAGYTFIFWGSVVRAGDQIDLDVNPDQMPPPITPMAGALRPAFAFQESNYWAQGVSLGVEGRW